MEKEPEKQLPITSHRKPLARWYASRGIFLAAMTYCFQRLSQEEFPERLPMFTGCVLAALWTFSIFCVFISIFLTLQILINERLEREG